MAAEIVEFLLAGITDNSGNPLAAGKVYTYAAGTTTPKAVYLDNTLATPATNPVILDSNGRKQIYADGAYKFVVKTAADVTLYTFDNLSFGLSGGVSFGGVSSGATNVFAITVTPTPGAYTDGALYSFEAHQTNTGAATLNISAVGPKSLTAIPGQIAIGNTYVVRWNSADDRFDLVNNDPAYVTTHAELAAANSVGVGQLIVRQPITLTANLTIAVPLKITKGGSIVTNGYVLTISKDFEAGIYQVFDTTTGSVKFSPGAIEVAYPQWWGALGDGSNDDTAEINACIAAVSALANISTDYDALARIHFTTGTYKITSTLNFTGVGGKTAGFKVTGCGNGSTLQFATSNTPGIDLTRSTRAKFEDLQFVAITTNAPNVLVLMARDSGGSSAGWHSFINCQFVSPNSGTVFKALIYSFGSEDLYFEHCRMSLVNPNCIGYYFTTINDLSVSSAFQTIATGEHGCKHQLIFGGTLADNQQTGADSAIGAYLHNSREVTIKNCNWALNGDTFIFAKTSGASNQVDSLNLIGFGAEYNSTQPKYLIKGDANSNAVGIGSIIGCTIVATDAVIYQPGSSCVLYMGTIQGCQFAGTAPTYMIDAGAATVVGGIIDCGRLKVRLSEATGGFYNNVLTDADFAVTTKNSTIVQTYGVGDEVVRISSCLAIYDGLKINKHNSFSKTWDPGSVANNDFAYTTINVAGAAMGDTVCVGFSLAMGAGIIMAGNVSTPGTVGVTLINHSGGVYAPGSGTLVADIWRHG